MTTNELYAELDRRQARIDTLAKALEAAEGDMVEIQRECEACYDWEEISDTAETVRLNIIDALKETETRGEA